MKKYGFDKFIFEVLEECRKDDLNKMELYYIKKYNSMVPNGYNVARGGLCPVKLKEEYVLEILNLLSTTELNSDEIGSIYGVSGRVVRGINSGENWYDDDIDYPIREKLYDIKAEKRKIIKKCEICGIEFETSSTKRKFCSQICCHKSQERISFINNISDCVKLATEYNSMTQIAKKFGVSDHCIKDWFSRFNFDFTKYKKSLKPKIEKKEIDYSIYQIDLKSGEVLNTFKSPAHAAKILGVKNRSHISEVCNGKLKQAYGYNWKYIKDANSKND